MDYKSFKNTINYFYPKLFQFSFILTNSDEKASSLVLQGLQAFLIKSSEDELSIYFFSSWLREAYFLSQRDSKCSGRENDEQAIVFLKYVLSFSLTEVSFVLNKKVSDIERIILQTREKLSNKELRKGKCIFSKQLMALLEKKEKERVTNISWILKHIKKCDECYHVEKEFYKNLELLKYSLPLIKTKYQIDLKTIARLGKIAGVKRNYFQNI